MKKYVYLCCLTFFTINMMAQQNSSRQNNESYCSYIAKELQTELNVSQLPPTPGWIINERYSDEFDNTSIDTRKWTVKDRFYHPNNNQSAYLEENVAVENGNLVISLSYDPNGITCTSYPNNADSVFNYFAGAVTSKFQIQYGYLETKCYMPQNYKYRPCFWTTGRNTSLEQYDEIDVFERFKDLEYGNRQLLQNCYNNDSYDDVSKCSQKITFSTPFTGQSSTFGVEFLPHEIVFYVNGCVTSHLKYDSDLANCWNTYTCSDIDEMIPMNIILEMMVTTDDLQLGTFPMPYEKCRFDYFRCYKLERGSYDTYHPLNFVASNESTKVYPHVILGGEGHSAQVNTQTALWAEQDIVLDKGFELPASTAFSARVISVPNPELSPLYQQNCH